MVSIMWPNGWRGPGTPGSPKEYPDLGPPYDEAG